MSVRTLPGEACMRYEGMSPVCLPIGNVGTPRKGASGNVRGHADEICGSKATPPPSLGSLASLWHSIFTALRIHILDGWQVTSS